MGKGRIGIMAFTWHPFVSNLEKDKTNIIQT